MSRSAGREVFARKSRIAANNSRGRSTYGTCPEPSIRTSCAPIAFAAASDDASGIGSLVPVAGKVATAEVIEWTPTFLAEGVVLEP